MTFLGICSTGILFLFNFVFFRGLNKLKDPNKIILYKSGLLGKETNSLPINQFTIYNLQLTNLQFTIKFTINLITINN